MYHSGGPLSIDRKSPPWIAHGGLCYAVFPSFLGAISRQSYYYIIKTRKAPQRGQPVHGLMHPRRAFLVGPRECAKGSQDAQRLGDHARAVKMRRPAGPARCSGSEVPLLPSVPPGRLGAERRPGGELRKPRPPERRNVPRWGSGAQAEGEKSPTILRGAFFPRTPTERPSAADALRQGPRSGPRSGAPLTLRVRRATAGGARLVRNAPPPCCGPQGRRNVPPGGRRGAEPQARAGWGWERPQARRGASAARAGGPQSLQLGHARAAGCRASEVARRPDCQRWVPVPLHRGTQRWRCRFECGGRGVPRSGTPLSSMTGKMWPPKACGCTPWQALAAQRAAAPRHFAGGAYRASAVALCADWRRLRRRCGFAAGNQRGVCW